MTDTKVISPERGFTNPHLSSLEEYKRLYEQSINDPVTFFQNAANENLVWSKPFTTTFNNQFKNSLSYETFNVKYINIKGGDKRYNTIHILVGINYNYAKKIVLSRNTYKYLEIPTKTYKNF